jgi:hypothetical protein
VALRNEVFPKLNRLLSDPATAALGLEVRGFIRLALRAQAASEQRPDENISYTHDD